jgi:hypothetical protein
LANPANQVSYQVGFDDTSATEIGEYVAHGLTAWAAMAANSWGEHGCCCTPSGASSSWSRADWLAHDNMLRACGAWIGEEAARYRVPLVKIGADDIVAGRSGVCGHGDCSAAGAGGSHSDPGPNFPWDVALVYAGGSNAPASEQEDDMRYLISVGGAVYVSDLVHYRYVVDEWDLNAVNTAGGVKDLGAINGVKGFGVPTDPLTASMSGQPWPTESPPV